MSDFLSHSKEIVEKFLQTAVFLDDEPTYRYQERLAEPVEAPLGRGISNQVIEPSGTTIEEKEHFLDATSVTNTFMEKGIVCSILNCEEETYPEKENQYFNLMKNADIIVLDWSLFKDNGERIVSLVERLISVDETLHELRSLIIYTASDIEHVKKQLNELGIEFTGDSNISNSKKYTFISIYAKPHSSNASEDLKVEFNELVDKCIDDFTKCFSGIVPNVAMASVSELRNNTHKLLGVLNKDLDIAYLSHRALLPFTDDAEEHIEEIVIGEIESIIHENKVGNKSQLENIKDYALIQDKKYEGIDFIECLEQGVDSLKKTKQEQKQVRKDVKECFSKAWFQNEGVSRKSEIDFVRLTTLQTKYTDKPVNLTLGVIIENVESHEKFLCLQPPCDSVRLEEPIDFIFIQLNSSTEKFDLLCGLDNKYKIKYSKEYRKTIKFKINEETSSVLAGEDKTYEDINGKKYQYLATLKKMQAQKIANEYGAYISRVGLNESEYLRRNR